MLRDVRNGNVLQIVRVNKILHGAPDFIDCRLFRCVMLYAGLMQKQQHRRREISAAVFSRMIYNC